MYNKGIIFLLLVMVWILFGLSIAEETREGNQEFEIYSGVYGGIEIINNTGKTGELEITTISFSTENLQNSGDEQINVISIGTETQTSGNIQLLTGSGTTGNFLILTGNIFTGNNENIAIYRLIISEVYYDGTDEWIEITNIGDGMFSGKFTLSGVKSSLVNINNVSLYPGMSMIFGDNLSQISGNVSIGKTGLSLNLIDTVAINIYLIISGHIEDSFLVDQYWVNKYNDKKTSFEKVGRKVTPVIVERVRNAHSNYFINPGRYFATGTDIVDVSFPPGTFHLPISCEYVNTSGIVQVSEIFRGNKNYPPYIELSINDDIIIDHLSISGNLLQTGITFSWENQDKKLEKYQKFLISSTGFRKDQEGLFGERNNNFSLLNTGKFLLITIGYRQSGQVMDIVYISGYMPDSSLYFNNSTYQCARGMDSIDEFSPGFERKFLKYMPVKTIKEMQYIEIMTGGTMCGGTGSSSISTGQPGPQPLPLSSFIPEAYTITILDVDYDPPGADTNKEKITLLATHHSGDMTPLDMSKGFRLKVNGKNKLLSGFLPMGVPTTFTKTFGFPNSTTSGQEVVITLNYGDYVFDTYTYIPNRLSEKEKKELTETGYYVSSVIDGDSFRIKYQGKTQTVRMLGIDAPESTKTRFRHLECFGTEAKMYLKQLIDKKRITFKFDDSHNQRDSYGRLLAYVYLDGKFINLSMLEEGYAKEYTFKTPYYYQSQFKQAELKAQQAKVGLWNEKICGYSMSGVERSGDLEETTGTTLDLSGFNFSITYVLPNPKGEDIHEELGLLVTIKEKILEEDNNNQEENNEGIEDREGEQEYMNNNNKDNIVPTLKAKTGTKIDMNYGFTLRIGNKKKDIRGAPIVGQEYIFSGKLGLVNKAACVSLFYEETELTKFCYPPPKEGQKIYSSYADFEDIRQNDFDILNALRIKRIGKEMCVIYQKSPIVCKRIPASKAETKTIRERALYKGFVSLIKNYLMKNWENLYYETEIKQYYDLLSQSKHLIARGVAYVDIYGQRVPVTSIKKQLEVIEKTPPMIMAAYEGSSVLLNQ